MDSILIYTCDYFQNLFYETQKNLNKIVRKETKQKKKKRKEKNLKKRNEMKSTEARR